MIIEHTFVTTLDAPDAFGLADELLASMEFASHDPIDANTREWRRGKAHARKASTALQLPQRLRMDFDRGRVTVAASVEIASRFKKPAQELMLAYAVAVENVLVHHQGPEEALAPALAAENKIRRSNRRRAVIGWSILGLIVLAIVIVIATW